MLELVDKKTFGFNTESHQGQESKRFSLFYKVKEGMFKKLLHDRVKQFVLQYYIKWSQENTSYFIWLVRLIKNRCYTTQAVFENPSVARRSYFSEIIQEEKLYL